MYTALLLDEKSKDLLIKTFSHQLPVGWEIIAHHMTINMGPASSGPALNLLNQEFSLLVTEIAFNDRVVAVGVETIVPSNNPKKHITLAVNKIIGAKPKESNNLNNWTRLNKQLALTGIVVEI